ncbi:MAG: ImmA/IrrE family metallo-endopeptidase [Nitrospirae bacterium]|nr:ImmA/IrrE family metallo-endopeptidase [Nitrospirota bacterium]
MSSSSLALRLKQIRESLGMKLTDAADKLGFSSYQILSNIEEGKREVKASELLKFSSVYYCSIDKLLGYEKPLADVAFVWRNPPKERRAEIEKDILSRCERYRLLESLLNLKPMDRFINVTIDDINTNYKVQKLASEVSGLLKLGRRPAFTLQKVLEQDYGIKVLYYALSEGSSVSTINHYLGNVVVINNNEAPWRQNFDLAHELFHLITWDAVVLGQNHINEGYSEDIEKKADAFASALLLPGDEVSKEIMARAETSKHITYSDMVDIAIEFGVSTQALVYRLFYLNFIRSFVQADAIAKDFDLLQISNKKRIGEWKERESEQFTSLSIRCLRKGLISRGKFAEFMEINDRSDIDDYITSRGFIEEEGNSIEIMAS